MLQSTLVSSDILCLRLRRLLTLLFVLVGALIIVNSLAVIFVDRSAFFLVVRVTLIFILDVALFFRHSLYFRNLDSVAFFLLVGDYIRPLDGCALFTRLVPTFFFPGDTAGRCATKRQPKQTGYQNCRKHDGLEERV